MSGRLFTLPPNRWEIDHAAAILAGARHLNQFGELPNTPAWGMLDRRYDLNPERFERHHPNIALLLDRAEVQSLACEVPIQRIEVPSLACEPVHTAALSTPEPSSLVLWLVAIGVLTARRWVR